MAPAIDTRSEQTVFQTALIRGDLKIIHDLVSRRFRLYDRATDPEEREDRFDAHPRAEELREALLKWEAARGEDGAPAPRLLEPTEAELERLRALGYVQ